MGKEGSGEKKWDGNREIPLGAWQSYIEFVALETPAGNAAHAMPVEEKAGPRIIISYVPVTTPLADRRVSPVDPTCVLPCSVFPGRLPSPFVIHATIFCGTRRLAFAQPPYLQESVSCCRRLLLMFP